MKTLYESILTTANVGKNAIEERIKEFFKKKIGRVIPLTMILQ